MSLSPKVNPKVGRAVLCRHCVIQSFASSSTFIHSVRLSRPSVKSLSIKKLISFSHILVVLIFLSIQLFHSSQLFHNLVSFFIFQSCYVVILSVMSLSCQFCRYLLLSIQLFHYPFSYFINQASCALLASQIFRYPDIPTKTTMVRPKRCHYESYSIELRIMYLQ